ncbi:MAG: SAVED domain-containing protein [Actinomycetota bacterium]
MPLRVFVSYQRDDLASAQTLESVLHATGMRAWRDLEFLPFGAATEEEVVRAIHEDCGAFVVLVTESSLESDFIWRVEIPAAIERAKSAGGAFPIVPVFADQALVKKFASRSFLSVAQNLGDQNGIVLDGTDDLSGLNRLAGRLLEALIQDQDYTPIRLFTHGDIPTLDSQDVVVDLRAAFSDSIPTPDQWAKIIVPGFRNIKRALLHKRRPQRSVWLPSRVHLSAALAYGWVFREVTGFTLDPSDSLLAENPEALLDPSELPGMIVDVVPGDRNNFDNLAMAISLAKDVRPSLSRAVSKSNYGFAASAQLTASSLGPASIVNTTHARQLAKQTVDVLLAQKDRFRTRETDLFVSSSVQYAAYLGYFLNACGFFRFWQFSMVHETYTPGVDLALLFDNDS